MTFRVVIPARYPSTRLPGKPLRLLAGKPMVQHVYERACASGAAEVIVATDDDRVVQACRAFGAPVLMTDPNHPSGTDRLAEVAALCGWPDDQIVVNVQGDEPLLPSANVAQAAQLLMADPGSVAARYRTGWFWQPDRFRCGLAACGAVRLPRGCLATVGGVVPFAARNRGTVGATARHGKWPGDCRGGCSGGAGPGCGHRSGRAGGGAAFSRQIRQGLLQNSVSARPDIFSYYG